MWVFQTQSCHGRMWGRGAEVIRHHVQVLCTIGLLLGVLGLLPACGEPAAPTNLTLEQRLANLAAQAAKSDTKKIETTYDSAKQTVTVSATVGWTSDITMMDVDQSQERAKTLCFQVQRALWTS